MSARSFEARLESVRRVVEAAKAVVRKRAALTSVIAESTGLSSAGVELALTKHLEVDPTDEELGHLIEHAGNASKVAVILSSNVFTGSLRAIALARAASADVVVRPSRRDPAFAKALVEQLIELGDNEIRVDESFVVESQTDGELHIYGTDATIKELKEKSQPNVRVRGHGSGMGVAWIAKSASLTDLTNAARGLAEDVVVFDQRGCLSPRVAFVEGDGDAADRFAEALHTELERLDQVVPRGGVPTEDRAAADRYVATMTYACRALVGTGHAIGIAPPGAPMVLSPPYRHVHVCACETIDAAKALIEPMKKSIVALGSNDEVSAKEITPKWARFSALGQMQKPRLDGPVDRREELLA